MQVDHSIVESFAQGGRTVMTSRIYPTEAIYGAARLFLFNNATSVNVKATLKIWQLNSAFIRPFPLWQLLERLCCIKNTSYFAFHLIDNAYKFKFLANQ